MSVIIHPRGEVGGGVAAHLQCPHCGHFSRSHAHQLTHMAATHPSCLDDVTVGRLGNILMYQSDARLFHCGDCFYTSRDFTKIYKHLISKHCTDQPDGDGDGGEDEEDEGGKDTGRMKRSTEVKEEEEEEEVKDVMKRSTEVKEEEEEVKDDGEMKRSSEVKVKEEEEEVKDDGERSVLMFDGAGYRCLICGWRHKLKAVGVNHVVRKHDIPKAYAAQAVRRDVAAANQTQGGAAEDEEVTGLSSELLKEEMEVTAKVVRWISNRFVCLICGHKTKLKGFAISHVVRCHDVERPYSCKECQRSFFLPSRLQQHVRAAHRPGRYACPFCCFRSHFLGGFRRHCSRCNAREEGEDGGGGAGGAAVAGEEEEHEEDEDEDTKETRGRRKRRRTERLVEEDDED